MQYTKPKPININNLQLTYNKGSLSASQNQESASDRRLSDEVIQDIREVIENLLGPKLKQISISNKGRSANDQSYFKLDLSQDELRLNETSAVKRNITLLNLTTKEFTINDTPRPTSLISSILDKLDRIATLVQNDKVDILGNIKE